MSLQTQDNNKPHPAAPASGKTAPPINPAPRNPAEPIATDSAAKKDEPPNRIKGRMTLFPPRAR